MRQSFYKDSIVFFGFVIPGLIALALCGGAWYAKSSVSGSLQQKSQTLAEQKKTQAEITQLEKQIAPKRDLAQSWDQLISKDLPTSLNDELPAILQSIPPREFSFVSTTQVNSKAGLATVAKQPVSQTQLAFRGTYRGLQKGLLELETKLPHLQVGSLTIDSNKQSNNLNVTVVYGAWTK